MFDSIINGLQMDVLNTVIKVAATLFALLGGFVTHYLLSYNEKVIDSLSQDYHRLRSTLHLFNYEPLYRNPYRSSKILGPILAYIACICQLWYIPALQGSTVIKNVLEASHFFSFNEELKKHFLDAAKDLIESRERARALPKGLFVFALIILILLAVITLAGLWIKLICEPACFELLSFVFYVAFSIFFVLFFAFIYDLKRLDAFFIYPPVYDFLKWHLIRCLIFASIDKDGVLEFLKAAKENYEDYTKFEYIKVETRKKLLDKAEKVAKQFLEKRGATGKDWEEEVEWTVPRAATEIFGKRFKNWIRELFGSFFCVLLWCCAFPFYPWLIFTLVFLVLLVLSICLLLLFRSKVGERKTPSFLENLLRCWDVIISTEQDGKKTYKEVKKELKKRIKEKKCMKKPDP